MNPLLKISTSMIVAAWLAAASFLISATGAEAGKFKTLYAFAGKSDGNSPSSLARDAHGNLLGFASSGAGRVLFKVTPKGVETTVYTFSGTLIPAGAPLVDSAGNIYAVAGSGGDYGYGAVFRISPDGTETTLHSFSGHDDGGYPYGGVTIDAGGSLYGTTSGVFDNSGTLFKIDPNGQFSVLHAFSGAKDGASPMASPIVDESGNLFGTTYSGGKYDGGTVYELSADGAFRVLHAFTQRYDGGYLGASLLRDSEGNLFGTATQGGSYGYGTVFEILPAGRVKVLHAFTGTGPDGSYPQTNLVQDTTGNLYGTTAGGGDLSAGNVFRVSQHGHFTNVHSFTGADGFDPLGNVVSDDQGRVYGTTYYGDQANSGTVFRVKE
jgi:uncharacterized repeat protein (TIGR03803 family)